jgi:AAHS family 4-hydroxybenzoate transporter-like MFS transporter
MIDIQTFINEQPFSRFQCSILAMCFAIVLMDGFDTGAMGFIAPSLQIEWNIQRPALAPVLSAALFGLVCGALLAGPMSDRLGRRAPLIASVLVFGLATLGSAFAADLTQLTALRFLTGIGLGAALPNAVTMMSEFCQDRRRAALTNLMSCGFPLGAALGGFLAAWLIPLFGWRSVLLVGGCAPVLLSILLQLAIPESVRFMVAKGHPVERIRATIARMAANAIDAGSFVTTEYSPAAADQRGVQVVLSRANCGIVPGRRTHTPGVLVQRDFCHDGDCGWHRLCGATRHAGCSPAVRGQ